MKRSDVAWAAGVFEGEGCFTLLPVHRKYLYARADVVNTDKEVIDRFHEIVGFGQVRMDLRSHRPGNQRDVYQWYTSKLANVERLVDMFEPWLSERRWARAMEVLDQDTRRKEE